MPKRSSRRDHILAIIPARLASTRFPRKVLASDTGFPLIRHVYDAASKSRILQRVVVATDSPEVMAAVKAFGGECVMTAESHPNGTSRLAQAARKLKLKPRDIVVNVQGDEPEMENPFISAAVKALTKSTAPVSTVALPFLSPSPREGLGVGSSSPDDYTNPNIVKVVTDKHGLALYFSRAPIPYLRDSSLPLPEGGGRGVGSSSLPLPEGGGRGVGSSSLPLPEGGARGGFPSPFYQPPLRHVGLYVYRAAFLAQYIKLKPTALERTESLEQLRILHHGFSIQVATCTGAAPAGIDTPDQYAAFVARWKAAHP